MSDEQPAGPVDLLDQSEFCFGETSLAVDELSDSTRPDGVIAKVTFPVLLRLDQATGDGRLFLSAGFAHRDLPITLFYKDRTTSNGGHDQAVVAGSLQGIEVNDGVVSGWGYLADLPGGRDALAAVRSQSVRGVSADLTEAYGEAPTQMELAVNPRLNRVYRSAVLSGLSIVPIPAFRDTTIQIDEVFDGALVASAVIKRIADPDRSVFANPKLAKPTPVEVTADGRVYGHLALKDTCHVGLPGCRKIPLDDDFAEFYGRGGVLCSDGTTVRTGTVFIGGPHADGHFDGAQAMAYYAATSYSWADVTVGYDEYGVWCAGVVRPDIGRSLVHHARASALSGDWRPAKQGPRRGRLTLKAILSVNSPGFPIVDYGPDAALVAAGPPPGTEDPMPEIEELTAEEEPVEELAAVKGYMRKGRFVRAYSRAGSAGSPTPTGGTASQQYAKDLDTYTRTLTGMLLRLPNDREPTKAELDAIVKLRRVYLMKEQAARRAGVSQDEIDRAKEKIGAVMDKLHIKPMVQKKLNAAGRYQGNLDRRAKLRKRGAN